MTTWVHRQVGRAVAELLNRTRNQTRTLEKGNIISPETGNKSRAMGTGENIE